MVFRIHVLNQELANILEGKIFEVANNPINGSVVKVGSRYAHLSNFFIEEI